MFPLGSVLFPHMPLRLRVFEQRYLTMLSSLLKEESVSFGVVLIERGQEVGGADHRFQHGVVAEIGALGTDQGFIGLVAEGRTRLEVVQWLPDEPFPKAEVRLLPELEWSAELEPLRLEAEQAVRRALALASEFSEQTWPADVELSEDPVRAAWQLAGVAPLGPLDQLDLLRSESLESLLRGVVEGADAVAASVSAPWSEP